MFECVELKDPPRPVVAAGHTQTMEYLRKVSPSSSLLRSSLESAKHMSLKYEAPWNRGMFL